MTLGQLIVNDVREQRNHESYPLDYTVTVQSSSSSSHFSFKQQQKPMNHLWWPDVYNTEQLSPLLISQSRHPEHHFCTVCFRILHKYDHNITDVYKNTHLFASIIIFQWLKSMSRDPKQTSELRWLLRYPETRASLRHETNSYLIHQMTKNQPLASLMIK